MFVRLFAALLLMSGLTLAIGCSNRAETSPPNDKEAVGSNTKETELKLLQGSWNCVLRTIGEKELFPSQGKRTLEIKGDTYGEGTLTVDNSAKPKRLDVKMSTG